MRYMKVRFTEWRDAPAPANAKTPVVSEIDAAQAKLAELNARDVEVRADILHAEGLLKVASSEQLLERQAGSVMAADNLFVARKAALAALQAAGEAADAAMKSHARVGGFGYQIISDDGTQVVQLVDEQGADLPAGAVYGYEIADPAPPRPAWAPEPVIEIGPAVK